MKGRLAYNGKPTREWIMREDKSSPTAYTESIFLTSAVDALKKRDIMTQDIPNAFIQTHMPLQPDGERVIMKVRGRLVDWLCNLDPVSYANKVVYEKTPEYFILKYYKLSTGCSLHHFSGIEK